MPKVQFKLGFSNSEIPAVAARYEMDDRERRIVDDIGRSTRLRGYFTKPELLEIAHWKAGPRTQWLCAQNAEADVESVTRLALATPTERLRIEALMLLVGVAMPTASVLLHLGHHEPYPILDFRALWSLGVDANTVTYNVALWEGYVNECRRLAKEAGVTMRELDRALWQFSKEHQVGLVNPAR